jgi:ribonuclease VapC
VIVDSSAVVAVVLREPGHERLLGFLAGEEAPGIGAPTVVETGIVLAAKVGLAGRTLLARFLGDIDSAVIAFEEEHWPVAVEASLRFGKGRHPAGLNFGDCLTYAVARLADEPLLCVGDDFAQTDLDVIR